MIVQYGQGGYDGASRSLRAVAAEDEGKLPLSRAVRALAQKIDVTQIAARKMLEAAGPCEAHHTSKYANLTSYYDVEEAVFQFERSKDPLGEYIEEAERCELYGYDGWRWLGMLTCDFSAAGSAAIQLLNSIRLAYHLALLPACDEVVVNEHHSANGCRIQTAANFRQWEAALRRLCV